MINIDPIRIGELAEKEETFNIDIQNELLTEIFLILCKELNKLENGETTILNATYGKLYGKNFVIKHNCREIIDDIEYCRKNIADIQCTLIIINQSDGHDYEILNANIVTAKLGEVVDRICQYFVYYEHTQAKLKHKKLLESSLQMLRNQYNENASENVSRLSWVKQLYKFFFGKCC